MGIYFLTCICRNDRRGCAVLCLRQLQVSRAYNWLHQVFNDKIGIWTHRLHRFVSESRFSRGSAQSQNKTQLIWDSEVYWAWMTIIQKYCQTCTRYCGCFTEFLLHTSQDVVLQCVPDTSLLFSFCSKLTLSNFS